MSVIIKFYGDSQLDNGPELKRPRLELAPVEPTYSLKNESANGGSLKAEVDSPCQIEQLPPELLVKILSQLDPASRAACAQLGRRWQQLVAQPILRRQLQIRADSVFALEHPFQGLNYWKSYCSPAVLVELHYRSSETDSAPAVQRSARLLAALLNKSPRLRSLTIEGFRSAKPADNPLSILGRSCPRLRSLRLVGLGKNLLTEEAVSALASGCPELTKLVLDRTFWYRLKCGPGCHMTSDLSEEIPLPAARQLANLFGRLTELCIKRLEFDMFLPDLPECTNIRVLKLSHTQLSVTGLDQLLRRCPLLTELKLHNSEFTDQYANCLATSHCSGNLRVLLLKSYHLSGVTASGLAALLDQCPSLKRLKLAASGSDLDPSAYRAILARLPLGIEDLHITGIDRLKKADFQMRLPSGLKRLNLTVKRLREFSILGLQVGLARCAELTELTLNQCEGELLLKLLTKLPRLRSLRLKECRRLVWCVLLRELPSCTAQLPDLHELVATKCYDFCLKDETVAGLCASRLARGLRRLVLHDCAQLTAAALASIASGCPWLTELTLACCSLIDSTDWAKFVDSYPYQRVKVSSSLSGLRDY